MFIRIIFSWTGFDQNSPIYQIVHQITDPVLAPIQSLVPRMGMFDLSPMIAMFLLFFLARIGSQLATA